MPQNQLKYNQNCSPLLCYRFVSTTLTAQIPNGNAIANLLGSLHTGKERNSETGFSYFGARYYDSDLMTSWLSVDPMTDKYPNISPYAYCAWNPIKLVDPDGKDWYETENNETKQKEIKWTDYKSQEEMDKNKQSGTYLGKAVVVFDGYNDEKLGTKQKGDNLLILNTLMDILMEEVQNQQE